MAANSLCMKIQEYGLTIRGHFSGKYKTLSPSEFLELHNLRLSYHKSSYIFAYKHGYKFVYIEYKQSGVLVRLFAPKQATAIMSFVAKDAFGGRASNIFEKLISAIENKSKNRVKNLLDIGAAVTILKEINGQLANYEGSC